MKLIELQKLSEGRARARKETAAEASARYEKFKGMLAAGNAGVTQQQVDGIKKIADSLWDQEMRAREKNIIDTHGTEWWELVRKQYPITQNDDGDWVVSSQIRKWSDGKEWPFQYKAQALEKVEELVRWLNSGRRRGFGDKEADVQKWLEKVNAVDKAKQVAEV